MQRVQLQLDLEVQNEVEAIAWVRRLAKQMEKDPELISVVQNSEMAPPLPIKGVDSRRGSMEEFLQKLAEQGREPGTPMGPWVKVDDYGYEHVVLDPESFDYRQTPEGKRAELERREHLGPQT